MAARIKVRQRGPGKDISAPFPFRVLTWADSAAARDSDETDVTRGSPSIFGLDEQFEAFRDLFPELFPQSPSIENRQSFQPIENPYLENKVSVTERYPCLRPVRQPDTKVVNGYLKFAMTPNDHDGSKSDSHGAKSISNDMAVHHRDVCVPNMNPQGHVGRLPQGFGSNAIMDHLDRKILRFCMYYSLILIFHLSRPGTSRAALPYALLAHPFERLDSDTGTSVFRSLERPDPQSSVLPTEPDL